ncbi:MAG: hypothetical protein WAO93_02080, partial [Orrella sp.]
NTTPLHMHQFLVPAIYFQTTSRRKALEIQDHQYKMGILKTAGLGDADVKQRYERAYLNADQDGRYRSLHHLMNLDEET